MHWGQKKRSVRKKPVEITTDRPPHCTLTAGFGLFVYNACNPLYWSRRRLSRMKGFWFINDILCFDNPSKRRVTALCQSVKLKPFFPWIFVNVFLYPKHTRLPPFFFTSRPIANRVGDVQENLLHNIRYDVIANYTM